MAFLNSCASLVTRSGLKSMFSDALAAVHDPMKFHRIIFSVMGFECFASKIRWVKGTLSYVPSSHDIDPTLTFFNSSHRSLCVLGY